jgi:DNA adenine methylase
MAITKSSITSAGRYLTPCSGAGKADTALLYAALFLYLNRHCFNGVYRVNQKGDHNVPFGKYAAPYFPADEMRRFAEKANDTKAVFIDGDFRTPSLTLCNWRMTRLFTATPYIPASKTANFTAYGKPFTLDDHRAWLQPCSKSPARHPLGDIQQRHPGNPRDLFRFQSPRLQRPPLCQRQKPRYGR